jgi:hypothetical protein
MKSKTEEMAMRVYGYVYVKWSYQDLDAASICLIIRIPYPHKYGG